MIIDTIEYGGYDYRININLKVIGQKNASVQFNMKLYSRLRKLMNAYCERYGLSKETLRFYYNGRVINDDDSPIELNMQDQDRIKVYIAPKGASKYAILLKVHDQDNAFIPNHFKVLWNTPLRKLMNRYCDFTGKDKEATRFRYNGLFINGDDTPLSLNMKDQDIINSN